MFRLFVLLAALIWGAVAHAEPPAISVIGIGKYSCGQFISTMGKHPPGMMQTTPAGDGNLVSENAEYLQWLAGFVTGFNAAHISGLEQQVTRIDLIGLDLWMRNWCNQNPVKPVFEGAFAFIEEMRIKAPAGQR